MSGRVISNTAPYHNTRFRTSVAVHNAAVQHPLSDGFPDSNPTIVVLQTDGNSSVKKTSFHSAAHMLLSLYHWRRRCLWFCVKSKRSNGCLADRLLCCKRLRMLRAETEGCVTDSMCCATVRDVTECSITAMRTICLSSREMLH
ncbi:hypothetical protein TNCV_3625921 [Trichonephila clavipes]|nr:hypothetical protein TNCV_3625921 [Trichonephila clavipes]